MKNLIQVVFKRGLSPTEVQRLRIRHKFLKIHLASLGVWQDECSLQYEVNDDLDFWFEDPHMTCPLRVHALFCLPRGEQYGFHIPLYGLPVSELVMEIPEWLVQKLPVDAFSHLHQIRL